MNLRNKKFATVAEYDNYIEGNYPKPNVSYIVEGGVMKYQKDAPDPAKQYLTFVILDNNTKLMYRDKGTGDNIQYSTNGGATWTTLNAGSYSPIFNAGDKIMWRGELMPKSALKGILMFANSTGRFNAKGNVMSLLYGDDFVGKTDLKAQYVFNRMFMGEGNLIDASNLVLPATTLTFTCYGEMFRNCTGLTTAPALPTTTLYNACYMQMFQGCTSLTTAPELPATILERSCYKAMFDGCSNLNNIKMLATNVSAIDCLSNWVSGVSATGTFTKAAGANIPTGVSGIPSGWTVIEE